MKLIGDRLLACLGEKPHLIKIVSWRTFTQKKIYFIKILNEFKIK